MPKVLFLMTHVGSGYIDLINMLNENPDVMISYTNTKYAHADDILDLVSQNHKSLNSKAIYGDMILFNHHFHYSRDLSDFKFIYLMREPEYSLNNILNDEPSMNEKDVYNYYSFRLRRMYELAKKAGGFLLNHKDINKRTSELSNYLELDVSLKPKEDVIDVVSDNKFSSLAKASDCFENYYYHTKTILSR